MAGVRGERASRTRWVAVAAITAVSACLFLAGCAGGDADEPSPSPTPTPSPSPAPRDPDAATGILSLFVQAVQEDRVEDAWNLYAASVPGDTTMHRADRGCDFGAFSFEFPKIRHLLSRIAPLEVSETHGSALGTTVVELSLIGVDGNGYLATLGRSQPDREYQLMFLNNGRPALVPGAPDPLPAPEDPQGFCGIWSGSR